MLLFKLSRGVFPHARRSSVLSLAVLRQVEIVGWAALLCAEADLMEIGERP